LNEETNETQFSLPDEGARPAPLPDVPIEPEPSHPEIEASAGWESIPGKEGASAGKGTQGSEEKGGWGVVQTHAVWYEYEVGLP